jgi:outer membrane murein-binding lipoprotein Lpp
MVRPSALPLLALTFTLLLLAGCAPADSKRQDLAPASSLQSSQRAQSSNEASAVSEHPSAAEDDAALVLQACGRPIADRIRVLHDKLHNGPVRELEYDHSRAVVLEFVPADSATGASQATVWRFSIAHMAEKEILASSRLEPWLPCAARALGAKY